MKSWRSLFQVLFSLFLMAPPGLAAAKPSEALPPKSAQKNMELFLQSLQHDGAPLSLSKEEARLMFLHAKGADGGNLLHEIARAPDLNPQTLRKAFVADYKISKNPSSRGGVLMSHPKFARLIRALPRKTLRMALDFKDRNGFTPGELAKKHKNQPALSIVWALRWRHALLGHQRSADLSMKIAVASALAMGPAEFLIEPGSYKMASLFVSITLVSMCRFSFSSDRQNRENIRIISPESIFNKTKP